MWYVYPSMWINQWFYDHPFDPLRGKIIHVEFDWTALDPLCPTNMTVAINWSTGAWSALGYGTSQPPLPGVDEGLYIGRETVLYQCGNFPQTQHFSMDYTILCLQSRNGFRSTSWDAISSSPTARSFTTACWERRRPAGDR